MMSSLEKGETSSPQLNSVPMQPSEPAMLSVWRSFSAQTSDDLTLSESQWQIHPRWPQIPYLWLEGRKAAWAASLLPNVTAPSPSHPGSHGGLLHLLCYSSPHPVFLLLLSPNSLARASVSLSLPSPPSFFALNPLQAASLHFPVALHTHLK